MSFHRLDWVRRPGWGLRAGRGREGDGQSRVERNSAGDMPAEGHERGDTARVALELVAAAGPEITADRQEPPGDPVGIGQGVPQVSQAGRVP